ncbi:MAG: integrase arm-type DNA-binding domain-containing protein [Acidobacteriaceae bacterium]|nr:integrase arm-type DNA-binding domain-containing protein [Acidobacteriaceae bacterium]
MRLTDTLIKSLKAEKSKSYKVYDQRGLYLLVATSGGKLWRFKYHFLNRERLVALGKYPHISLATARQRQNEAQKLLAHGIDPMAQRRADKRAALAKEDGLFQKVAMLWYEHWQSDKSPRHVKKLDQRMKQDIFPAIGKRPIMDIEAPELVAMAKAIESRGASDVASRALTTTRQIFRWAIANGFAKRNPASEFRSSDVLKSVPVKHRARIDALKLPELLRAIEAYQGTRLTQLAMKMMALTFVRTRELLEAEWSEFDLENLRWTIPPGRMKKVKREAQAHIVPLASQTVELLETLRTLSGDRKFIFPGERNPNGPMSNMALLMALRRMGYQGIMTGHGFRGLASTILHEKGYQHEHIEVQLAHVQRDETSAAYNEAKYLFERTKMMQDWADYLEQTQRGAKVLSISTQMPATREASISYAQLQQ